MQEKEEKGVIIRYILLAAFVFMLIILLLLPYNTRTVFNDNTFTGAAVSVGATAVTAGGNFTMISLFLPVLWKGFYGNLTQNATLPTTIFVNGSFDPDYNVYQQDLNLLPCNKTELYATNFSVPSLPNVTFMNGINSAIKESIDEYLQVDAIDGRSGSKVFTNLSRSEIGDDELLMYSAFMEPKPPEKYFLGLLETRRRDFVFVTNITINATIFNNNTADYQIMLPVPLGQNITYYFFQDITDDCDYPAVNGSSETAISNVTIIYIQSGGGSSEKEARCGNEECERLENCKTCELDCGICPSVTKDKVVYQTKEKIVYVNNQSIAIDQLKVSGQYIIDNPQCTELKPLLQKAEDLMKQGNYAESVILLKQIIDMCKDIVSKTKVPSLEFRMPLGKDKDSLLKILFGLSLSTVVALLSYIIYRENKFKKIQNKKGSSENNTAQSSRKILKQWK